LHATYNCKYCTYYLRDVLFIAHHIHHIHIHHIQLLNKIFKCSLVLAIFITFVLTLYLCWPHIFNSPFFINGTRSSLLLPLMTEYFVNEEDYFYLILIHTNLAFIIGIITMLATGTMFIVYQQHACGMFRIAR